MKPEAIVESDQEQAVASWINYLNQVRLDRLMQTIRAQNSNLSDALGTIDEATRTIQAEIIDHNRGGGKGVHGFIAEVAECGVGNARRQIEGKAPNYTWINDNGPTDLLRDGVPIQQKFSAAGGNLSLGAIKQHHDKYPHYLENGGKYQIPQDHYQKIQELLSISAEDANKMQTSDGNFSLKTWKKVHDYFDHNDITIDDIEPSYLDYKDVQKGAIRKTMTSEKESLRSRDQEIRDAAYAKSKPTVNQAVHSAAASAVFEGGTTFVIAIVKKCRSGKTLGEFTKGDWSDILAESGKGTIAGGVRGVTIYALTNFTATPAAVASSLFSAGFGIAEQAHLLRVGAITKQQFMANSEVLCIEGAVSALSSLMGEVLIPIPVLGAVIGNTVGVILYQIVTDNLSRQEKDLITDYLKKLKDLDHQLNEQYRKYVMQLNAATEKYYRLLDTSFSPDIMQAFDGSVGLAQAVGVPSERILKTTADIDRYFLE